MDFNIKIGTSLSPLEKTVSRNQVVRDVLTEIQVPFNDGQVALNGRVLGTAELNQTFGELGVKNGDFILATNKHGNGAKPI